MSLQDKLTLAMFGCFTVAGFLVAIWLGFVMLGLVCLVLGLAAADGRSVSWRRDQS